MKTFLISAALIVLYSCAARREVQVQMVNASLIKIDTVYRFNTTPQKQFTRRDESDIHYVTYAPLVIIYPVGTQDDGIN